ncbi:MAG: GTP cyclohydrolase I FolE [Elusimicrobia bacterium]|nr:GTP cyclohydrolase I FolE [Elusimicrobiota bacterium]MBI4218183.1 GTP cyclohydrolase I FolE [Elusimicrobiota bacterium]
MEIEKAEKILGSAKSDLNSRLEYHVESILRELGMDSSREGLRRTPKRVAEAFRFFTQGYAQDPDQILSRATFSEKYNQMVLVKDVNFFSLCEHHLLPFYGKCHVGYIPDGKVVGLSKIPRVVDAYARRLQIQERLTQEIASAIESVVKPRGVGVVIEAFHLCMAMRGVEKQNAYATTSAMLGVFESHERTRMEFLSFIRRDVSR